MKDYNSDDQKHLAENNRKHNYIKLLLVNVADFKYRQFIKYALNIK